MDELLNNEELLRILLEESDNSVMLFDRRARCLSAKGRGLFLMGLSGDQSEGMSFSTMWPEELQGIISFHVSRVLEGRPDSFSAYRFRDTEKTWWNISLSPVHGKDGEVSRFIALGSPIVIHKKADETMRSFDGKVEEYVSERTLEFNIALDKLNESQEALFRREAELITAIESLPFDFFGLDKNGRYFIQNEASRGIYGDIIGKRPEDITSDEKQLSIWLDNNRRAFRGEMIKGEVEWVVGKEKKYFYNVIAPIWSRGKIEGILGFNIDISELKAATESIRQSEEKFRGIVESINDFIIIVDMDGRIIDVNRTACERMGYTREEMLSMRVEDMGLPEFASRAVERMEKIREQGKAVFESAHIRKDGSVMPVEVSARMISYKGEKVFLSVVRDITDRKKIEQALQESILTARTLLDTPSAAAFLSDREGICLDANETFARRFGRKVSDIVGRPIWDLFPPQVSRRRKAYFDELLRTKKQVRFEDERQGMWNDIIATPILDNNGEVSKVVVFGFDITDRKRIEKELRDYRDHLEELVTRRTSELSALNEQLRQSQKLEAVGILAGGIAHEFNNILATMKGAVYLMEKKLPEDSPVMKYAEQVLASIGKATNLSRGLLAFSRKQTISLRPVRLNRIIDTAAGLLLPLIGEHIELAVKLSERGPAVMADINQVEQVLANLVTNARDAMPEGGRLEIATAVMKMDDEFIRKHGYGVPGEYAVLSVSDRGTGMEEETKEKIFEPFFTTKAVGKGSGLGLAVTYGIVKQHNGFIDAESVPGKGTTFVIYFPTVEAEVAESLLLEGGKTRGGEETVLLAEDDEDTRATMSEIVRMAGYTVFEARDGEEAVKVFMDNKEKISLVFLDVRMPKKNGRIVYEEIRRKVPLAKFLFISGYTADIMDSIGVSGKGFNFISKAASPDEILGKIREILDQ